MGSTVIGAAPSAYDRHVGRYGPELATAMLRFAGVAAGQRALDVGCGPGALTEALAALLGADRVAAVDPSERFVAACRARVPGADVRVGRAEELPFADATFDAVLAQLVVDGLDEPGRGVAEMRRVARPGGVVAACVWDFGGGMPFIDTVREALLAFDAARAATFGVHPSQPVRWQDDLATLWRDAGLRDVTVSRQPAGAGYSDVDDLLSPLVAGLGRLGAFVEALDERERATLKQDLGQRLGSPAGPFRLTAHAWCVRGLA